MKRIEKLNNRGFSLIEMIVSVLIAAVLMLGVATFLTTSRSTYSVVSTSAKLQEEALVTENFYKDIMREALDYGSASFSGVFDEPDGTSSDGTVLCVKARENENDTSDLCLYFVIFKESTGELYYKKCASTDIVTFTTNETTGERSFSFSSNAKRIENIDNTVNIDQVYALISTCIKSIDYQPPIKTYSADGKKKGVLFNGDIVFEYNNTEYQASVNAASRNSSVVAITE